MARKRILVVDDEKGFTEFLKETLEETGRYEVKSENDGKNGFPAAKDFCPDIILLDVLLPEVGGFSIAVQMKNDEKTKNVPIVFLTGTITPEEAVHQQGVWGEHFFAKPVKMKELIEHIEEKTQKIV